MLHRAIASLNYRLNLKHLEREPAGCREYRDRNAALAKKLQDDATEMLSHAKFPPNQLYGAGGLDYLLLYRYVRERKPDTILELGGGLTTLVMATALSENGAGHLVSIDHIQKFSDQTRELLPVELRGFVTFACSFVDGVIYKGASALRYKDVPRQHYDLIYVDGPPVIYGAVSFPSVDAIEALTEQPSDIIVDRRLTTLHHYARWMNKPVTFDPINEVGAARSVTSLDLTGGSGALVLGDVYEIMSMRRSAG